MKNFYEILEINQNASQEIVEKAYKVLVKKYHPDLQTDSNKKQECEAKIKEINEAYETLSNPDSRLEYDNLLKAEQYKEEQIRQARTQNQQYSNQYNRANYTKTSKEKFYEKQQAEQSRQDQQQAEQARQELQQQYQEAINKAYQDAYVKRLKDMGYRIKYKKTPKQHLQTFIIVIITIGILFLICQLPFVKEYFKSLYDSNPLIKAIADMFMNLFK